MGRTTLHLAANSKALIYTLDLPPKGQKDYSNPVVYDPDLDVYPEKAGIKFQNTIHAERIRQLYGNSLTFDFSPFYGKIDCVFVDANHHYDFVLWDSMNAFKMIKSNGVIIWHDYASYAPGVIKALGLVNERFPLIKIRGTSLVIYLNGISNNDKGNCSCLSTVEEKVFMKVDNLSGAKDIAKSSNSVELSSIVFSNGLKSMIDKAEKMIKSGNLNQAQNILLNIVEKSPDNVNALQYLAIIEYRRGNFQSSKEFIKVALIIDPTNDYAKSALKNIQKGLSQFRLSD
jgi:hypothetical protein